MTFFYTLNKKLADIAEKSQPQTLNEGREEVYREYKGDVQEKWDTETKVSPEEKGKYSGKSKAELQKQYNALKARGPHKKGSPDFGKMRELAFAIRAKSDWGKVSETQAAQGINTDKSSGTGFKATGSQGVKPTGDLKHGMPMRLNTGSGRLPTASLPEGDMEEGNEFSGELAQARAAGKKEFEVDGKTYPVREAAAKKEKAPWPGSAEYKEKFGQDRETFRKKHAPSVMKDPKGREELAKLDTEYEVGKKSYGRDEEGDDEEGDKKAKPAGEKRGRGRPKGSKRAIGAKGPSGKSKLLTREDYDKDEYDEEGEMAMSQARTIEDAAEELQSILDADENLPEWVQKKISLAQEYIDSARDYLKSNRPEQDMDESALQAYLGKKKYGEKGMKALQKAGRDGASKERMANLRAQHDKLKEGDRPSIKTTSTGFTAAAPSGKQLSVTMPADRGLRPGDVKVKEQEVSEKAVSKAQRAAAGIARAAQKGEIPRSELRGASKEMARMEPKELRKFAKTKEKGLPDRVKEGDIDPNRHPQTRDYGRGEDEPKAKKPAEPKKPTKDSDPEEKVSETTTAGSVATAPAAGGKKSKGGMQFGKGIYDSMNREVEAMISESMNVSINMNTDAHGGPSKSVTVTATDEDAEKLAALLRMAGLAQGGDDTGACSACGKRGCGCGGEQVDENKPDWPTNTETSDDALQYSGGLNKPKATGQTTVPVIASQADRQHALEGDDELRRLRERAGIFAEARKKPDFPDLDKDGDRTEPMSKAIKDKESKVDEAVEGSLWNLYKRLQ